MHYKRTAPLAAIGLFAFFAICFSNQASAKSNTYTTWKKVYKVQVEYWYWDTESYYWGDYYESEDYGAANFVYAVLQNAKNTGILNQAAPHTNWKFIAVDVRLVVQWQPICHTIDLSDEQNPRQTIDLSDYYSRE
ncbi:hypothetical protein [Stieleria varia]|uniref:Uncharacterized protein n=1 Tax=Stieleria varia TaxID=2528005 RepID=A0A5C6A8C2_9BACT|nr:hypothetical protein [Stieleria varia]TWT94543.1 hypothetical protein Pla52n_53640 [Stieleria varia]